MKPFCELTNAERAERWRRRRQISGGRPRNGGWALLLELIIFMAALALLARARFAHFGETQMLIRIDAEDKALDDITDAIWRSTQNTDLTNANVLAITGEIGPTDTATTFSTSTSPTYTTTNHSDWFAKVGTVRGVPITYGIAPTPSVQPSLAKVLYNSMNQPRLLFIRPTVQSDKVQILLISLLATPNQLVLPPYEATDTWFDAIASWDFTNRSNTIPPLWTQNNRLTAAQIAAWNTGVGGSMVNRLRVRLISIPKIQYTVNNNDSSQYGWVYWNNGGGRFQATPASGSTTTPPIIINRIVTCASGLTEANEIINYKEPVKESGSFTVK